MPCRCSKPLVLVLLLLVLGATLGRSALGEEYQGTPYVGNDLFADTWVATDALGRAVPGFDECGPPRADRTVAIFYWIWHVPTPHGPFDNTRLLAEAQDGKVAWPEQRCNHHWGEPELGYYLSTDPFVIRKHASWLSDAGIDAVIFDTTNPRHVYRNQYEAMFEQFAAMRQDGARTPALAFMGPFPGRDTGSIVNPLWQELYQPGRWPELWFRWDGKPLLMADRRDLSDELRQFFTLRTPKPNYWRAATGPAEWSWLQVYPQHVYPDEYHRTEQISVGVAQNALAGTPGAAPMSHRRGAMGRSWHDGQRDPRPDAVAWGLNFAEQWNRALEQDPKFVFVSGWNEWTALRLARWTSYTEADATVPGGLFIDEYTQEYSRDCEPMRGGHSDNYYYQLASFVRRYKGVRPAPKATGPRTITIDGTFDDWRDVTPEYRDTIGDTLHRDHPGYGKLVYQDDTGRNDFVQAKAAYDAGALYFFVQTREKISPRSDRHWMLLYLDADRNAQTGWHGYDYLVNLEVPSDTETVVKAWRNGGWQTVGRATYRVNGNGLELAIPRPLVQMTAEKPTFDFHWADNPQTLDDVSEFAVHGDSAPNRRWNYRFEVAP